jgi:predicted glycoside hydrolase/deacetylase ChbG (UPF0249 family)
MSDNCKSSDPAYLVINADDYGYFKGVSRGILKGASKGVIGATGVMANAPDFDEYVTWLAGIETLDIGVHLNLTHGRPLSLQMQTCLEKWAGEFPGKYVIAVSIMTGKLPVKAVLDEWRAQIQRCLDAGLEIIFLNTHEHIHMLPMLFKGICSLADQYDIPFVRYPAPEWQCWGGAEGTIRNLMLHGMHLFNRRQMRAGTLKLVGMSESGKLNINYLEKCFASFLPGKSYELMCHPGYSVPGEVEDKHLLAYHHWEQELDLLLGKKLQLLCEKAGIELVGYRDLLKPMKL